MEKKEQKKLTLNELNKNVEKLKKDLFNLRFQKSNGQLTNPAKVKIIKKDISRMLTQIKTQEKRWLREF